MLTILCQIAVVQQIARLTVCGVRGVDPDRSGVADSKFLYFHCGMQLWERVATLLRCLGRLSLPPSMGQ